MLYLLRVFENNFPFFIVLRQIELIFFSQFCVVIVLVEVVLLLNNFNKRFHNFMKPRLYVDTNYVVFFLSFLELIFLSKSYQLTFDKQFVLLIDLFIVICGKQPIHRVPWNLLTNFYVIKVTRLDQIFIFCTENVEKWSSNID